MGAGFTADSEFPSEEEGATHRIHPSWRNSESAGRLYSLTHQPLRDVFTVV